MPVEAMASLEATMVVELLQGSPRDNAFVRSFTFPIMNNATSRCFTKVELNSTRSVVCGDSQEFVQLPLKHGKYHERFLLLLVDTDG